MEMEENVIIKIAQITSVHNENSTRIFYKECVTLANNGYNIIYIVPTDKDKYINGVKIKAVNKPKKRFERFVVTLWKIYKIALLENADIYHFHDPELISVGLLLKLRSKKVIYDVHEDYSKQILSKKWIGNKYFRKIVAFLFNIFEQIGVMFFNRIIAATPDIARKFPKNKTIILRNFPILKLIDNAAPINYKKDKPVIIYAGGLTKIRGIREIVHAMEYINDDAELWLLGKWENERFKEECKKLKGWKHTKYLGFKKLEEVYRLMKIADIGVFLIYPKKRHKVGLPTKAFEYMACSLPIVLSDFPYRREVFGDCALFADPNNVYDIANKINNLIRDPALALKLEENGRSMVEKEYNWEIESKKLLQVYEELLGKSI